MKKKKLDDRHVDHDGGYKKGSLCPAMSYNNIPASTTAAAPITAHIKHHKIV
jgi:hypothetical protein